VLPFFWVWTDELDAYVSAAEDHPAVKSVTVLSRVNGGALCRPRWADVGTASPATASSASGRRGHRDSPRDRAAQPRG
jgi:hypothetical protein